MQTIPYILFDENGERVPDACVVDALRRARAACPVAYVDVFGTDAIDPHHVLVSDHNADNVATLLGGSHICAC